MPNRIIKESIRTSKSVNALSDFEFRVWTYLVTYVDDYGRGSADPELLKGFLLPRRKGVTEQQISNVLASLANTGMITLYEVDGESFLCFPNWDKHQRIQAKKSKFPAQQKSTVSHGESPPESNPIRIQNPNPESEDLTVSSLRSETVCRTSDVRRVIDAWNSLGLQNIRKILPDSDRGKWLRKRVKDYGIDDVLEAIEKVRHSDFLMGNNKRGWQATFDWFIRPNNFPKVLSGNYDNSDETQKDHSSNVFLELLESGELSDGS